MRRALAVLTTLLAASMLAACGSSEPSASAPPASASSAGPVNVTDSRGTAITLDAPASKVVVLEWGLVENVIALGVQPVGVADTKGYANWVTAATLDPSVKDVGTRGEPSVDSIVALQPDLVLATSDSTPALIAQIEKYVPVMVIKPNDPADPVGQMKDNQKLIGTALGRSAQADAALTTFDAALAAAKQKLASAGKTGQSFTFADGWLEGGAVSIRMYAPGSYAGALATSIGLKNAWTKDGDPSYGLAQTDVEGVAELPAGTEFLYIGNDADGGDVFATGLANNRIWKGLPFVRAGNVHRIKDGVWMFGGPLSGAQLADELQKAVTA